MKLLFKCRAIKLNINSGSGESRLGTMNTNNGISVPLILQKSAVVI